MNSSELRREVVRVFDDSAAMPGNERAFEIALQNYEKALRQDVVQEIASDVRSYPGVEIEGDPLRGHDFGPDIVADYILERVSENGG